MHIVIIGLGTAGFAAALAIKKNNSPNKKTFEKSREIIKGILETPSIGENSTGTSTKNGLRNKEPESVKIGWKITVTQTSVPGSLYIHGIKP